VLFLIMGLGSIGQRHLRNLLSLGAGEIIGYDVNEGIRHKVADEHGIRTYGQMEQALAKGPDVALICTPTSLHIPHALVAAEHGCHLFIEKPLSHSLDQVDLLIRITSANNLVTMVGCNMRFHPGPLRIKSILDSAAMGRVYFARIQTCSYLPGWRPWQDYRQSYSARPELGGGCVLDCIHEIDLARWYLGEPKFVYSITRNLGALGIDAEEISEVLCEFNSGVVGSIHLDYVSRSYERSAHIIGEKASLFWSYKEAAVLLYLAEKEAWERYPHPLNYDTNLMFADELAYFVSCVQKSQRTYNEVDEARRTLTLALAAKESSLKGQPVRTGGAES